MPSMLLAFECVSRTASACVVDGTGERAFADLGGGEAEQGLSSLLDGLIRAHGRPSALAVAAGPGSFTGLRIAAVTARTLAWLEDCPVHTVDALAAVAAERGDGLWWVLVPLKKDTTFHGLFQVVGGRVEILQETRPDLDADAPVLDPRTGHAVATGPGLTAKPGLAQRWCPGIAEGDPAPLTARGVARLAPQVAAQRWRDVLPAYHQKPAPVLQREAELRRLATLNRTPGNP